MKRLLIILSLVLITVSAECQLIGRYPMHKTAAAAAPGGDNNPPTPDGTMWGWYTASYTASFTENSGVEVWADSLASGHNLEYYASDATSKPTRASNIVTFDGVNDELRTNNGMGFTLSCPVTYIMYVKQITWTSGDRMIAGRNASTTRLYQYDGSSELELYGGTAVGDAACTDLTLDTWGVVVVVFNGANSFIQVNGGTKRTVSMDVGSSNPDGISLANNPDHGSFGNMAFREVIVIAGVEDDTNLAAWYNYLNQRHP